MTQAHQLDATRSSPLGVVDLAKPRARDLLEAQAAGARLTSSRPEQARCCREAGPEFSTSTRSRAELSLHTYPRELSR